MRFGMFALVIGMLSLVSGPTAQAKPFWEDDASVQRSYVKKSKRGYANRAHQRRAATRYVRTASRHAVGGRPARWCGWWMRTQLGGGPEFNLAANWRKWGRSAGGPQVGAVVVWPHHVGMITGRSADGRWIVKSGNDGGRVRERARSVSGAVFRVA